jgi:hypothetical protein
MVVPVFVPVPDFVIYDPSLSSDERSVLLIIAAETTRNGCKKKDASLALSLGMKVARFKKNLREVVKDGRVVVDEGPEGRTLTLNEHWLRTVELETTPKGAGDGIVDLFDPAHLVVPDAQVNRLIQLFFSSGINPLLVGKPTQNRFFASPFNRDGARRLIVSYGAQAVEDTIGKVAKRKGDKFCPKLKSLWMLYHKWDNVQRFLDNDWRKPKHTTTMD